MSVSSFVAAFVLPAFLTFDKVSVHPDEGQLLSFGFTTFDDGSHYMSDNHWIYFPFTNNTGHDVVIADVFSNNEYGKTPYDVLWSIKGRVIADGQRDSIGFKKRITPGFEAGRYDNSWTITFENSPVRQHLNIFCELKYNTGRLEASPVILPTVHRGDMVHFTTRVANTGSSPVSVRFSAYNYLTAENTYPVEIPAGESRQLSFKLATEQRFNTYHGNVVLTTNEEGYSPRLVIPYSGELISVNHPSIRFDSTLIHLFIERGQNAEFHFWFTNDGDAPLLIEYAKTSCGCLVASWPRDPIQPGERNEIKIKYDSYRVGPINKSCTVKTNASSDPVILRVLGNVNG